MSQAGIKTDLRAIVGDQGMLEGAAVRERAATLWHGRVDAELLVRPRSTEQVSAILRLCHGRGQPVVTHGGLTGLVNGADADARELILSLESMNSIERVDVPGRTLRAQAGAKLGQVQRAAEEHGMVFPLDLGARDSATVGGNISTNAGGLRVLRYGMMRNLVLGIEAVLADGTVLTSLNKMLKNNAGYDLKHLFIGTEGTLGIVTRAVLRLFPRAQSRCSALLAVESFEGVINLLHKLARSFGGGLSTYEVMWNSYYHFITDNVPNIVSPFGARYPLYVLTELEGSDPERDQGLFESVLSEVMEEGLVVDAAVASSQREREGFWKIRDGVAEIGALIKGGANFDVSVPISVMQPFLDTIDKELTDAIPGCRMLVFGHVADSNLHFICYTGSKIDVKRIYEI